MSFLEIVLLGVALSMDAFAVSISDVLVYRAEKPQKLLVLPIAFGLFQGAMPVFGYLLSGAFAQVIEAYSGIVSLLILGIIGSNMVRDGISELRKDEAEKSCSVEEHHLTLAVVLAQGVATAIDAFAVGVSLRAQAVNMAECAVVICCTTFLLSLVALRLGKRFGTLLGDRAQVAGGLVLIGIGLKAMFF